MLFRSLGLGLIPTAARPSASPTGDAGQPIGLLLILTRSHSVPTPPANTALPSISGIETQGQTLTANVGSWASSPTSYAYQWERAGTPISGATNSTYVLQAADVAAAITVVVTASNVVGASDPAESASVTPAAALAISGTPGGGTVSAAYSFTPSTSGGHAPYTYALTGTLPAGLGFDTSTGVISGTPTTEETASGLDITVTDDDGLTDSLGTFSISVEPVASYEGFVASRGGLPNSVTSSSNQQMMSRSPHYACDDITALKIAICNFRCSSGIEVGNASAATVEAAVEYPAGVFTRIQFSGADEGNLPAVPVAGAHTDGSVGMIISDSTTVSIADGELFWIRVLYKNAAGIFYLNGTGYRDAANGQILQRTSGDTYEYSDLIGTLTNTSSANSYAPAAIIGQTTKGTAVLIGDSIMVGDEDFARADRRNGIVAPSLPADAFAFVNLAVSDAKPSNYMDRAVGRSLLFPYGSNVINNLGVNIDGTPAEKMAANVAICTATQAVTGIGFREDAKHWIMTVGPRASSTTGYTDTVNQADIGGTDYNTLNGLVRALPSPFVGYFDLAAVLGDASNERLWEPSAYVQSGSDGVINSGSLSTFNSAGASFTSDLVGHSIRVEGAGPAGADRTTKISAYVSGTTLTMESSSSAAVSGADWNVGGRTSDGLHPNPAGYAFFAASGEIDWTVLTAP